MVPQAWCPQCSGASNCGEIISTFIKYNRHELSLHVATQRGPLTAIRVLHRFSDNRNGFSLETIAGLEKLLSSGILGSGLITGRLYLG